MWRTLLVVVVASADCGDGVDRGCRRDDDSGGGDGAVDEEEYKQVAKVSIMVRIRVCSDAEIREVLSIV